MLERTQVFVDTSYLLASFYNSWETGARAQLEIDLPEVVNVLGGMIQSQLGQPIQRQMWYDGIPDSGPHRYQRALRTCDGVQLRAGQLIEWGERRTQKAVDTRLVADMVIAGLRGQCSDIVLVSGDADMLPGVKEATAAGLRVHLYGFGWDSMSSALRHACDSTTILDPREDFADCMQLQVLEGPLPPVVRGKPVGDVEPPEDKGPTRVPNLSPHMPHGSAPLGPAAAPQNQDANDSAEPDGHPADRRAQTRQSSESDDATGTSPVDDPGAAAPGCAADTEPVPAADTTTAGEADTSFPDSGEQPTADSAQAPDSVAATDTSTPTQMVDNQQPPVTGDAAATGRPPFSADTRNKDQIPVVPSPASVAESSPAVSPATNAGVRQHPGSEAASEEDARQRAIVEAHRESQDSSADSDSFTETVSEPEPADDAETSRAAESDAVDSTPADGDSGNDPAADSSDDDQPPAPQQRQSMPTPGDVPKKTVPLPSMMAPKRRLNSRYVPVSNEVWESAGFQTPYDVGQQYAIWWYDNAATDEQLDRAHELSGGALPNEVDRPLLQFACERLHEYTLTDTQRVALRDGFHHGIRGVLINRRKG